MSGSLFDYAKLFTGYYSLSWYIFFVVVEMQFAAADVITDGNTTFCNELFLSKQINKA